MWMKTDPDDAVDYIARETGAEVIIYQEPTYDLKQGEKCFTLQTALYIQ